MIVSVASADQTIPRESLTQRVADAIRAAILTGEYKLGERLREATLVKRYGVSSSVVREALYTLQGEGIVVADPYRGRAVYNLSEAVAKELVVVRTHLESLAAFLAAEKLDDEWAARISTAASTIIVPRPSTYAEWIGMEIGFHRTIWEAARLEWLCRPLSQLSLQMLSVSVLRYFSEEGDFESTLKIAADWEETGNVRGHQALARSILGGDPEAARQAMILHLMSAASFVERRKQVFHI